jgi:hypothetical protein
VAPRPCPCITPAHTRVLRKGRIRAASRGRSAPGSASVGKRRLPLPCGRGRGGAPLRERAESEDRDRPPRRSSRLRRAARASLPCGAATQTKTLSGAGLRKTLRKEGRTTRTRSAKADRHPQRPVPADQSARRPIIRRIIGGAEQRAATKPPGPTRHAGVPQRSSVRPAPSVTGATSAGRTCVRKLPPECGPVRRSASRRRRGCGRRLAFCRACRVIRPAAF